MSRLDPVSLKLFITVVEKGTIAAAAEHEHLSAPAVSKRLIELESFLQTELLVRTNKGIEPTVAGLALLSLARGVLHELDQVQAQMESFTSGVRGLVRVCASMSAITQFLAEPIQAFVSLHPNVQLQLEEKTSPFVVKAVADNAADIGIFVPVVQLPDIQTFPFRTDQVVAITPLKHPLAQRNDVTLSELVDHDLVGLNASSAIQTQLSRIAENTQRSLRVKIQVTSFDALCMMVSAGLGVGLLPLRIAMRHRQTTPIHITPISDAAANRTFLLAVRDKNALSAAARFFLDHLLSSDPSNTQA